MSNSTSNLQLVSRVAKLLRLLAANNRTGMRLVDILRAGAFERSTAHRLLQSLVAEGLVIQDRETKRYYVGMAIYEMGVTVPSQRMRDLCLPYLKRLALGARSSVFLSVRSGFDGVCVDREEGGEPIAYVVEPGRRRPLSIGVSNIALLSCLSESEIERIRTENWPRVRECYPEYTQQEITARLRAARDHGFVLADVLQRPGIRAMGMPVRDARGQPLAAIGMSALQERWSTRRTDHVVTLLRQTVDSIRDELSVTRLVLPSL
ncbi:IclR family transcriptional regulator [Paraburkholderia tropica]|uniref:IclR family transcriptional regulator n=1 Tax=Paraburkholderia tropica TaxID=92647 RepID=UPI003018571E